MLVDAQGTLLGILPCFHNSQNMMKETFFFEENGKAVNYPVEWLWRFILWVTQLNLYALNWFEMI